MLKFFLKKRIDGYARLPLWPDPDTVGGAHILKP